MANLDIVLGWINQDFKYANSQSYIVKGGSVSEKTSSDSITLYTDNNKYLITIWDNYLCCGATSRKPRAGEGWTRGNDLADGDFSKDTWHSILADIVSFEMVRVNIDNGKAIPFNDTEPLESDEV